MIAIYLKNELIAITSNTLEDELAVNYPHLELEDIRVYELPEDVTEKLNMGYVPSIVFDSEGFIDEIVSKEVNIDSIDISEPILSIEEKLNLEIARNKALADRQEFLEDIIAEMAMKIYD